MNSLGLLASFMVPMHIGTDPVSMLWMLPLLLGVAFVYKAIKVRVMFMNKYIKEVGVLFASMVIFIIMIGILLHIIVHFLTT